MPPTTIDVAIIGTGMSGIAAAHALKQADIHDFMLFEAADAIGGTWRDNTYPGCACDVPSHLYSLSFAPNPDWSQSYASQPEIRAYLQAVFDDLQLASHTRLSSRITRAAYRDGAWQLTVNNTQHIVAKHLILGIGALREPRIPEVAGVNDFAGLSFHSARWRHDATLDNRDVVVVGTGASAIQVIPAIAERCAHLTVIQRTAPWIAPRHTAVYSERQRAAFRRVPGLLAACRLRVFVRQELMYAAIFSRRRPLARVARRWLSRHAAGTDVTLPDYDVGCKRVLVSDAYYPALRRDNVTVRAAAVTAVTADGLALSSGDTVSADVIVWCTGFSVSDPLGGLQLIDRNGRSVADTWSGRPSAYLGIAVADCPNAYLMLGPNSALGHSSVLVMIEAQARYAAQAITESLRRNQALCVRPEVVRAFVDEMDHKHRDRVWQSGGCHSWYQSDGGANFTIWPGSVLSYLMRTHRFMPADYEPLA